MKNFIKLCSIAFMLTVSTACFSQTFGVKAGLSLANLKFEDNDLDTKLNPGFHIGPMIDIPIGEIFSFETGLFLSTKGLKISGNDDISEYTNTINMYYLDVPLTAKLTHDLGNSKIYGMFGPYFGVGLIGKAKYEMTYDGDTESFEEDIEFGSDENLNRLDFGLTLGAGLELNSLLFGLSYDLGLVSVSPDEKINNRVLRFSIGYKFSGK